MKAQTKNKNYKAAHQSIALHSTISAAVHCINPVPIHYHKK
jgi:hypothetical protein